MIKLSLPEQIFYPLFQDAAMSGIIIDGKVLADATPLFDPKTIVERYLEEKANVDFDLKAFLDHHFDIPVQAGVEQSSFRETTVKKHIENLWDQLYRQSSSSVEGSTLIQLPYPYIVPGGRFNEIYYWDSFFTMLGLRVSGKFEVIEHMIDNFAWMIDHIGFVPNGNRTYFLSRSQPPFFALMVALLAEIKGDDIYRKYLAQLRKEYDWWMDCDTLSSVDKHVVKLENDVILNRYYDMLDAPRTEMYEADTHLAHKLNIEQRANFFSHIRAACESGWDFSSRWCFNAQDLTTIRTKDILPVDLNCLIYHMEKTLAHAYQVSGNDIESERFTYRCNRRAENINNIMFNAERGYYFDYDHVDGSLTDSIHVGGVFPLFVGIASPDQAERSLQYLEKYLLKEGGIVTTTINSGQQWDSPNGWAPLQWIAYEAAQNYGRHVLASQIAHRWLALNDKVYQATGKMMEKYNVEDLSLLSGGGEYPVQDGFGWTNGVYLAMTSPLK